jgi:DNA transformation protein
MSVTDGFIESVRDLLGFVPDLRLKRMFGGLGVYTGDSMFALAADDVLYLKVDDASRAAFEAEGSAPFVYTMKDGKAQAMGYWRAPEAVWDGEDEARRWARLGIEAAQRARAPKRKPARRGSSALLISGPWDDD